jgi:glucosamine-6-phosphate deaminase
MEIIIQPTPEDASAIAARIIANCLKRKPNAVLGLATGSTPLMLYRELVLMNLDWSRVTTFNLDEYAGLAPDHPQSYHAFMRNNLFRHINIRPENTHIPDGQAKNIPAHCQDYESQIARAGGLDLQLLGIGRDGHIGFNEPSSSLASRTRIKTLTPETRRDNARFFGSESAVPKHVITMGIGTICEAREIVLLAFGAAKAEAVAGAVEGPVTAMNPASVLQLHRSVKVCLDEAAAANLKRTKYYRWVYDQKPEWQRF